MSELSLIDQAIGAIVDGHGEAGVTQFMAHNLRQTEVAHLIADGLLTERYPQTYILANPLIDLDPLVLVHWAVPQGIVGGLTALIYRYLSVARLVACDIYIPVGTPVPAQVADLPLRPHVLSADLLAYGLEQLRPSLPGTVEVPAFSSTVALAQLLADDKMAAETQQDAVLEYLAAFGRDTMLIEALGRYGVAPHIIDEHIAAATL